MTVFAKRLHHGCLPGSQIHLCLMNRTPKFFLRVFRGYKMATLVGNGLVMTRVALMMILDRHCSKTEIFHKRFLLRISSHLLKKSLLEKLQFFCAVSWLILREFSNHNFNSVDWHLLTIKYYWNSTLSTYTLQCFFFSLFLWSF